MGGATDAATRGVNAVTVSPGQSAAAAADKWMNNTMAAKDKFARRVGSVSLGQWQQAMTQYGISRMAQGAQQKQGKMQSFMAEYLPFLSAGVQQIHSMPKNTIEDSIARATAMIRYNHTFQRGAGSYGGS
jgi:hypothetical protein